MITVIVNTSQLEELKTAMNLAGYKHFKCEEASGDFKRVQVIAKFSKEVIGEVEYKEVSKE